MKTFASLFLMFCLGLTNASAEVQENCCFCIADWSDAKSTQDECKSWLKGKSKDCSYSKLFLSHHETKMDENLSCRKVEAYGANHGLSYIYYTIFDFVEKAALKLSPVEVHYDGTTCNVFNNVEMIESEAKKLSASFPNVKFVLQGNQNQGVVTNMTVGKITFIKPYEDKNSTSKMKIVALGGSAEVSYDKCSAPKKLCGFSRVDSGGMNDPNLKFCTFGNDVTTQACCPKGNKTFGEWGIPGMNCKL